MDTTKHIQTYLETNFPIITVFGWMGKRRVLTILAIVVVLAGGAKFAHADTAEYCGCDTITITDETFEYYEAAPAPARAPVFSYSMRPVVHRSYVKMFPVAVAHPVVVAHPVEVAHPVAVAHPVDVAHGVDVAHAVDIAHAVTIANVNGAKPVAHAVDIAHTVTIGRAVSVGAPVTIATAVEVGHPVEVGHAISIDSRAK